MGDFPVHAARVHGRELRVKTPPLRCESDGSGRKTVCPFSLFLFSLTHISSKRRKGCQQEKQKPKGRGCPGGSKSGAFCESQTVPKVFLCSVTSHLAVSLHCVLLSKAEEGYSNKLLEALLLSTTVYAHFSLRTGRESWAQLNVEGSLPRILYINYQCIKRTYTIYLLFSSESRMTVLISGFLPLFRFYFYLPVMLWFLINPLQKQNKYVPSCPRCQCTQACSAGKHSLHNRRHDLFTVISQINVTTEMWVKASWLGH